MKYAITVELYLLYKILDTARHSEKDPSQTKNQESPPGLGGLIVPSVAVGPRIRGQAFFASTLFISSECDVEKIVFREIRDKEKNQESPPGLGELIVHTITSSPRIRGQAIFC